MISPTTCAGNATRSSYVANLDAGAPIGSASTKERLIVSLREIKREIKGTYPFFYDDADRRAYLDWLAAYCVKHRVSLLAYCLMRNHVHIVAVPESGDGLERVFRPLHTRYAQRINRAKNWRGHVLQGRYFSSALDGAYFWAAIRYVERNPVRAQIVGRAEDYRWSSAASHCGLSVDPVLATAGEWVQRLDSIVDGSTWWKRGASPFSRVARAQDDSTLFDSANFTRALESIYLHLAASRKNGRPQAPVDSR